MMSNNRYSVLLFLLNFEHYMETSWQIYVFHYLLSLVSIHVLAGRTTARDASRCMDTNDHKRSQPSQQKHASSQQSRTC